MSATVRAALISLCVIALGLVTVQFEVENRRQGARILELLKERDSRLERIRRLEIRYNRMVSPDVLERRLLEDFGPTEDTETAEVERTTNEREA